MKKQIELMADYGCFPLWWADGKNAGDIDPTKLPLSQKTIDRLEKWADIYDDKLNWDDPMSSSFLTLADQEDFEREGMSLWYQLRKELTPEYEVFYYSQRLGKHLSDPIQLEVLI